METLRDTKAGRAKVIRYTTPIKKNELIDINPRHCNTVRPGKLSKLKQNEIE